MKMKYFVLRKGKQLKETFRERILYSYRRFSIRHPRLKFLVTPWFIVLISLNGLYCHVVGNTKRYIGIVFSVLVFLFGCSFTSSVFPGSTQGFIAKASDYDAMVGQSNAELADPVTPLSGSSGDDDKDELTYDESINDDGAVQSQQVDKVTLDEILQNSSSITDEEEEESETAQETSAEDESEDTFDPDDWKLTLVNKQHPIPDDYEFQLGTIHGNMKCDVRVMKDLLNMFKGADQDGVNLVLCSPYRDMDRQKMLFARKINYLMKNGDSYMDAYKEASQAVTVPGASEHQIGLAFDIISDDYSTLDEGFENTSEGKWLRDNSYRYGFVLRYMKGKEDITGIEYEPWHYRYVGVKAATIMHEQGITLEEFWDKYL